MGKENTDSGTINLTESEIRRLSEIICSEIRKAFCYDREDEIILDRLMPLTISDALRRACQPRHESTFQDS